MAGANDGGSSPPAKTVIHFWRFSLLCPAGIGLGCIAAGATQVTDGMMAAAARAVAGCVTDAELNRDSILPDVDRIRWVAVCHRQNAIGKVVRYYRRQSEALQQSNAHAASNFAACFDANLHHK